MQHWSAFACANNEQRVQTSVQSNKELFCKSKPISEMEIFPPFAFQIGFDIQTVN